ASRKIGTRSNAAGLKGCALGRRAERTLARRATISATSGNRDVRAMSTGSDGVGQSAASRRPHVIIVGAGFGGLAAAKALAHAQVGVTLLDRRNHHLFQPLLYQVATAGLAPAQIASPIRSIVRDQANTRVILADVTG